jgi:hypothetical protein
MNTQLYLFRKKRKGYAKAEVAEIQIGIYNSTFVLKI